MRILAFLSFLSCVNFKLVYTINCTTNQFESKTGLCCDLCSAGEFMSKECGQAGKTTCLPCPKNRFTSTPNNLSSCKKCRDAAVCDGGRHLAQGCTPTSDIQCVCPSNKYWNTQTLRCEECTVCDRGERLISRCETYKNSVCKKCQQGTYLDSSNKTCVPCSYCHKGDTVVRECVTWEDTMCEKVKISSPPQTCPPTPSTVQDHQVSQSQVVVQSTTESRSNKDYPSLSPVLCEKRTFSDNVTWLLLVVVILLLFVVFVLSSQLKKRKPLPCYGNKIQNPKDSVVYNEKPPSTTCIKENNIRFNTIPADVTEDLGTLLNAKSGKNWKHLAGIMGYPTVFTANLELTPLEACQRLLQEWEQGANTTVYALYSLLKQLGRDDAARVLLPYLVEQSSKSEIV